MCPVEARPLLTYSLCHVCCAQAMKQLWCPALPMDQRDRLAQEAHLCTYKLWHELESVVPKDEQSLDDESHGDNVWFAGLPDSQLLTCACLSVE